MKSIYKNILPAIFIIHSLSGMAQTPEFHGFTRNYTGVLTNGDLAIVQNTLDLRIENSSMEVGYKVNPYIYHYSNYSTNKLDYGIREAYIDLYFNSIDIRLGKQQIIWGKADGVFITDIVSPKDLREFLLQDFNEIRMGINAAKIDYYINSSTFELVWIPVFEPTSFPDKNSLWFPNMLNLDGPVDYSTKDIDPSIENSEVFLKYSRLGAALDFEIMGAYTWDDDPSLHIRYTESQSGAGDSITYVPRHHRLSVMGGSFSADVSGLVFRGEGAYYTGKKFSTAPGYMPESLAEKDYVHFLAGTDFIKYGINFSVQYIQEAIIDYNSEIYKDQFSHTMTFLLRDTFLREKLTLEFFAYVGLTQDDALLRPKISYDIYDGMNLLLGANIFTGNEGNFGQYNDNDMMYLKLRYDF